MTIKPIDIKTSMLVNQDASRLREDAKTQEAGQAHLVAQQQVKGQEKFEAVQNSQATESKVIRKEDEGAEKEKSAPDRPPKKAKKEGEEETDLEKAAPLSDGVRGSMLDVKA